MFRVSSAATAAGAVIFALMIADLVTHPEGTKALGSSVTNFTKTLGNQLIGVPG